MPSLPFAIFITFTVECIVPSNQTHRWPQKAQPSNETSRTLGQARSPWCIFTFLRLRPTHLPPTLPSRQANATLSLLTRNWHNLACPSFPSTISNSRHLTSCPLPPSSWLLTFYSLPRSFPELCLQSGQVDRKTDFFFRTLRFLTPRFVSCLLRRPLSLLLDGRPLILYTLHIYVYVNLPFTICHRLAPLDFCISLLQLSLHGMPPWTRSPPQHRVKPITPSLPEPNYLPII